MIDKDFNVMQEYHEMNKGVISHLVDKSDILREMAASILKYEPLLSSISPRKSGLLMRTSVEILEAARQLIDEGIAICENETRMTAAITPATVADHATASPSTVTETASQPAL